MSNDNVDIYGITNQTLPSATVDGVKSNAHFSKYGEVMTQPMGNFRHTLADEGSYYVATNPTPFTGLIGIAASDGFDDLETFLHIRNTSSTKRVYLDYLRLQVTAAGTNGVTFSAAMKLDTGATRFTSGGATITPVSPNMATTSDATAVVIKAGPCITTAATSDARLLATWNLRIGVIKVVGDTYLWKFGAPPESLGVTGVAGTAVSQHVLAAPPVVLGENDQFLFHEFGASQTVGAAYLMELGFWYR
jgi:hypothetical protein